MTRKTTNLETKGITMGYMPPALYDWVIHLATWGRESTYRREFVDLAHIQPGDRVLDIGCGTGTCALLAADDVGASGSVLGVDATPNLLNRARKKAASQGNVRFDEGLAESIPAADNSVDIIRCTLVMHHLPDDALQIRALAEMNRILKPDGKLLIVDLPSHSVPTMTPEEQHQHHKEHRNDHRHQHHTCGCKDSLDIENDPLLVMVKDTGFVNVQGEQVRFMGALAITGQAPSA
jgi:ubiquinone/menaquinone biosynthesis C-methylase UbiE